MADEKTVEDIERVEIAPSDDSETIEPEGQESETKESQETAVEEKQPKEQLVRKPESSANETESEETASDDNEIADVEGETPRERALRLELTNLRREKRKEQIKELLPQNSSQQSLKKELSAEKQAILNKYKPEEIQALSEVIPVIAESQGYVRADQLTQDQYNERAEAEFDKFIEKHPEYSQEKDKDGVLWNELKKEFSIYAKPANPKDYAKILNRSHNAIFNIKPVGDKGAISAAQKKIQVASHAGASAPTRTNSSRPINSQGLRLDMLKGFSDEEKAQMLGT
jgi:hypothetical protein